MQQKIIILLLALALLQSNVYCTGNARPLRNNDINTVAEALKYLQDLDTYYTDRARIRFGRRTPGLLQMLTNRLTDTAEMPGQQYYPTQ